MKIIQEGHPERLKQTRRFHCFNCGCIFEADDDEYTVDPRDYILRISHMDCPCCGKSCMGSHIEGND